MSAQITFLGHAGFRFATDDHAVVIDPFLTGNPAAIHEPEDIACGHIALTHGHADHIGDTLEIAQANDATIHAAFEIAEYFGELGYDNVSPGNPGGTIATDFGWIAFTQAFHSSSYEGRYMGMPCGLVIGIGDVTIYHAGDTGLFSDMKMIGELYRPDVAILPIGDRFTMGPELATKAAEWIGAPKVIPCHFNTWPPIEQDPADLNPEGIEVVVMAAGQTITVG